MTIFLSAHEIGQFHGVGKAIALKVYFVAVALGARKKGPSLSILSQLASTMIGFRVFETSLPPPLQVVLKGGFLFHISGTSFTRDHSEDLL